MNLTGSYFEYMMRQNKASVEVKRGSNALPTSHKCYGCDYARERACAGYCMKDIIAGRGTAR